MPSKKAKEKQQMTRADLKEISSRENILIKKEKRFQKELEKMRRPQVEKLTQLKETKKKPQPKPKVKSKSTAKKK